MHFQLISCIENGIETDAKNIFFPIETKKRKSRERIGKIVLIWSVQLLLDSEYVNFFVDLSSSDINHKGIGIENQ